MRAEIALSRSVVVGIYVERIIRTSLHASFAANAAPVVEIDDSVPAPEQRAGRTNFRTRRVIAVIAPHHPKVPRSVRDLPLLYVLYPSAKYTHRYLVFFFASDRAGMTSNTPILIDDKSVSHLEMFALQSHDCKKASTS